MRCSGCSRDRSSLSSTTTGAAGCRRFVAHSKRWRRRSTPAAWSGSTSSASTSPCSPAREPGLARTMLEKGLHAGAGVLGLEDLDEQLLLEVEPLGDREVESAVDGALGVGLGG